MCGSFICVWKLFLFSATPAVGVLQLYVSLLFFFLHKFINIYLGACHSRFEVITHTINDSPCSKPRLPGDSWPPSSAGFSSFRKYNVEINFSALCQGIAAVAAAGLIFPQIPKQPCNSLGILQKIGDKKRLSFEDHAPSCREEISIILSRLVPFSLPLSLRHPPTFLWTARGLMCPILPYLPHWTNRSSHHPCPR